MRQIRHKAVVTFSERAMMASAQLSVRVNDELILDAGTCAEVSGQHGPEWLIHPPKTTMFHQVFAYLWAKPDPERPPVGSMVGREGIAAAAMVLRWGSYLAVLLDRDKPVWAEAHSPTKSRISDEEMARINIEVSAALAEWIDFYREDPAGRSYTQLVNRAVCYLPMTTKQSRCKMTELGAYTDPSMAKRLFPLIDATRLDQVRADAEHYPSRMLADTRGFAGVQWQNQRPDSHGILGLAWLEPMADR